MGLHSTGDRLLAMTAALLVAVPVAAQEELTNDSFDCSMVGHLIEDATREELRDPKLHVRSTKLYFSQELFAKAAREAELAVHLDPSVPEAHMRLGMAYAKLGCFEAAGDAFEAGLELCGRDERTMNECEDLDIENNRKFFWNGEFQAGGELFEEQRLDEAAQRYRNAIAIDGGDHRAWLNLGLAHGGLQELDQALEALARAHELSPDDERTTEFYRKTLQQKAIEEYQEANNLIASDASKAREVLASSLERLDLALSLDPPADERMGYLENKSLILRFLGSLQEQAEDPAANDSYAAAIETRRAAASARAEAVAAGAVDGADETEVKLDNLLFTILCFDAMGEVDSTLTYARRVIDLDPKHPDGYSYVASALNTKGEKQESIRFLLMNVCLSDKGKKVEDVNAHFVGLLSSYEATDEIVMASITSPESPEDIRVYSDGNHVYEAWVFWSQGYAQCYYDGQDLGKVEFEPVDSVKS